MSSCILGSLPKIGNQPTASTRLSSVERAKRYLAKCPIAVEGNGGDKATYSVVCRLIHGFNLSPADTLIAMADWNNRCQPPWNEEDLQRKIQHAASSPNLKPQGYMLTKGASCKIEKVPAKTSPKSKPPKPTKPKFCPEVLHRIAMKTDIGDVVQFISNRSPVGVAKIDSADVLRKLYPIGSGEKVVIFSNMKSQGQRVWHADNNDWLSAVNLPTGPEGVWFLPQPVDGRSHPNPRCDSKFSCRSQESVTAWRFAVVESDDADSEDWLRCLIQMPLRITSLCESGGRSIHALVRIDADSKAEWDSVMHRIKPLLVTLGADPGALSAVRLTRLPQAMRGERLQRLLYLNPEPDGTPIIKQAVRALGLEADLGGAR